MCSTIRIFEKISGVTCWPFTRVDQESLRGTRPPVPGNPIEGPLVQGWDPLCQVTNLSPLPLLDRITLHTPILERVGESFAYQEYSEALTVNNLLEVRP